MAHSISRRQFLQGSGAAALSVAAAGALGSGGGGPAVALDSRLLRQHRRCRQQLHLHRAVFPSARHPELSGLLS